MFNTDKYKCNHFSLTTNKISDKVTELICIDCQTVVATWEELSRQERERLEIDEILKQKEIEKRNKPMYYYADDVIKEWI